MPLSSHDEAVVAVHGCDDSPRTATTNYQALLQRYESYAPRYDRRWARYTAATLEKTLEYLPSHGAAMLDVACGTGTLLAMVRDARPHISVTGIDLSPDMLERARRRVPENDRVRWLQGSAERIPAADGAFDIVTCTNAFHLVQNAQAALAECRRVLQPGGSLVIVDWCMDFAAMRLLAAWLAVADRQVRHLRTMDQMTSLLRSASFLIEHAERFRATRLWGLMVIHARCR